MTDEPRYRGRFVGDGTLEEMNGRYDQEAGAVMGFTEAESVLLVVVNGSNGSGCTLLTTKREHMPRFAELLEAVAAQLREDIASEAKEKH
ncbi:hypothetical protein [Burkholderia sp. LMG 21824]|uniref:hypothetical protein n=1 Tax=Burkholderia sp. LMG 21824 TaxID=3158172 RepID=UPI003C2E1B39